MAWFSFGRMATGKPPMPARAFSGTSCTGFHPVGSGGAAGEPRLNTHDACDGVVTSM